MEIGDVARVTAHGEESTLYAVLHIFPNGQCEGRALGRYFPEMESHKLEELEVVKLPSRYSWQYSLLMSHVDTDFKTLQTLGGMRVPAGTRSDRRKALEGTDA